MSIEFKQVEVSFGEKVLFKIDHLLIPTAARVGIIGKNGSGKTTLAELIAGIREPDGGIVHVDQRVSLVEQLIGKEDFHSGGEQTKAKIQAALKEHSGILIADEPTNHLDQNGIRFLEKKLRRYPGTLLLISHNRTFLNQIITHILAIENQQVTLFEGNYQQYLQEKEKLDNAQKKIYQTVQQEKKKLKAAIRQTAEQSKNTRKAPKRMGNSEARLHKMGDQRAKKNLDQRMKAMETRLENLPEVEKQKNDKPLILPLTEGQKIHRGDVLRTEHFTLKVQNKVLLADVAFQLETGKKVALIGDNGTGKTTLLKSIYDRDLSIQFAKGAKLGYFSQNFETLQDHETILENLENAAVQSQQVIRDLLAHLQFRGERVFQKVSSLSGGERSKVAIGKLLVSDANVLLLDEPTNHLDIQSMEVLESALKAYQGTILFVSHDEAFVDHLGAERWEIQHQQLRFPDRQRIVSPKAERDRQDQLLFEIKKTELLTRLTFAQGAEKERLEKEFSELLQSRK